MGTFTWVVAVPIIVWIGVLAYVLLLERRVAALEVRCETEER